MNSLIRARTFIHILVEAARSCWATRHLFCVLFTVAIDYNIRTCPFFFRAFHGCVFFFCCSMRFGAGFTAPYGSAFKQNRTASRRMILETNFYTAPQITILKELNPHRTARFECHERLNSGQALRVFKIKCFATMRIYRAVRFLTFFSEPHCTVRF